ncbi:hypothetical protein [Aeoliella sp. SH292]|uniref:hypothetical protein n=1 Tax=Aeoliella sp. SH292 TaxID=3454464 RepID=UPI003F97E47E
MAQEVRATKRFTNPPPPPRTPNKQPDETFHYGWSTQEQRAVPVAFETPPTSPQIVETNHYVPYETSKFQNAYAWAASQVARKLPASVETLHTLESLIKQQMNGNDE